MAFGKGLRNDEILWKPVGSAVRWSRVRHGLALQAPTLSLSKNAHQARAEMGVLEYKREKNEKNAKKREGWLSLHFLFANFLRFMAANLSLTQLETWARPAVGLSRILCKRICKFSHILPWPLVFVYGTQSQGRDNVYFNLYFVYYIHIIFYGRM